MHMKSLKIAKIKMTLNLVHFVKNVSKILRVLEKELWEVRI